MKLRWTAASVSLVRVALRVRLVLLAAGISGCQPAPTGVAVAEPMPSNGVGYIVVNAPIAPTSRDLFITNVDKLRAAGAREIDIGMNSPGGAIDSAQDIVDYMARLTRDDGITFKAFNIGLVASAATYVFLNAQTRYSSARGVFLFHAAGLVSNGLVTSERLRESADKLDLYEKKVRSLLARRTHLTESETQTYVRRTVLLNADDARRDGIIDGIAEFDLPKGVRTYIISTRPATPSARPTTPAPAPEQPR